MFYMSKDMLLPGTIRSINYVKAVSDTYTRDFLTYNIIG